MLDDHIGLFEAGLDIAALEVHLRGDVAWLTFGLLLLDADRNVPALLRPVDIAQRRPHQRRAFLHSGNRVDHRWQRLVLDLNQRERFFGNVRVAGENGGDRLAVEEHLLVGEDHAAPVGEVLLVLRQVGRREHRLDPRVLASGTSVY